MSELSDFNLDQRVQTTVGDIMEYARVAWDQGYASGHSDAYWEEREDVDTAVNPFAPRETIEIDATWEEVV